MSLFPRSLSNQTLFFNLRVLVMCAVVLLCLFTGQAFALEFVATNSLTFSESTSQPQEIWALSDTISGNSVFGNDTFFMAQRVDVTGVFEQDLWMAANAVSFTGTCHGHIRILAASAQISGKAGDNVIAIATTVEVTKESVFEHNAFLGGQNTISSGNVKGDLTMYAGQATLEGIVEGDVLIVADDIVVMPNTQVLGNLEYISNSELVLDSSVQVKGAFKRREITELPKRDDSGTFFNRLVMQAYLYLGALLTGGLWLFAAPRLTGNAVGIMRGSMLRCFVTGAIALVVIPTFSLLLFFSMVGIPLMVVLLCMYACMIYIAKIISAFFIGLFIYSKQRAGKTSFNFYLVVLSTGLLIIYGTAQLPGAMLFVWLITTCTGLGALILALARIRKENKLVITIAGKAAEQAQTEANPEDRTDESGE